MSIIEEQIEAAGRASHEQSDRDERDIARIGDILTAHDVPLGEVKNVIDALEAGTAAVYTNEAYGFRVDSTFEPDGAVRYRLEINGQEIPLDRTDEAAVEETRRAA